MEIRLDQQARNRLTAIVAGLAMLAGLATLVVGHVDNGIRLARSGDHVVVADVQPRSVAALNGLQAGMVVTQLEGVTLIEMPRYVEPDPAMPSPDPLTGETPPYEPTIQPARAT